MLSIHKWSVSFVIGVMAIAGCAVEPASTSDVAESVTQASTIGGNTPVGGSNNDGCPAGTHEECGMWTPTGCMVRKCVSNVPTPPVIPCGDIGQACCGLGNTCNSDVAACLSNTCTHCGNLGEHACNGGVCTLGVDVNGTCIFPPLGRL